MKNRRKRIYSVLFFLTFFFFTSPGLTLLAGEIEGMVVGVADGDTIKILDLKNRQHKIRLYGIDCPERGQAFGRAARKYLASHLSGKKVSVKKYDIDRYGRLVGVVYLGGTNINKMMIAEGYAWQYKKYCKASFCDDWLRLEERARISKVGLWQENKPHPPWRWRSSH